MLKLYVALILLHPQSRFTSSIDVRQRVQMAAEATATAAVVPAPVQKEEEAEQHWWGLGDNIKSVVFGGVDGIITTFAIVASVEGAQYPLEVIILTGFAKLLGDGLAMGLGDAISEGAEHHHILNEKKREEWEYQNYPQGEINEMVEIYMSKGFTREEAVKALSIMTKKPEYTGTFIDHMMVQELGHQVPGEDDSPAKAGAITFGSFMFFGSIPLWAYVIFYGAKYYDGRGRFGICIAITLLCLYALGAMQAKIIKQNVWTSGALMTINGAVAAAAAYLIGWGLQQAVSTEGVCLE